MAFDPVEEIKLFHGAINALDPDLKKFASSKGKMILYHGWADPQIPAEIAAGKFDTLHGWLTENLYRHGSKFTPNDLIKRATGEPMTMQPYLAYLRSKYGELYSLHAAA